MILVVSHRITFTLPKIAWVFSQSFQAGLPHRLLITKAVSEMVEAEAVERARTEWALSVVYVPRKDLYFRAEANYRLPNANTKTNCDELFKRTDA